jgi:hypothetical protein
VNTARPAFETGKIRTLIGTGIFISAVAVAVLFGGASTAQATGPTLPIPATSTPTITASPGPWTQPAASFSYQWNENSVPILGATDPTLVVPGGAYQSVGSTLTVNPGAWSPTPSLITYQWYRNGKAISGATSATYVVVLGDSSTKLTVVDVASAPATATTARTSAAISIPKASLEPVYTDADAVGRPHAAGSFQIDE